MTPDSGEQKKGTDAAAPTVVAAVPLALVVAASLGLGIAVADALASSLVSAAGAVVWTAAVTAAVLGALAVVPAVDAARWPCLAGSAACVGLALGVGDLRAGFAGAREGPVRLIGTVASAPRESAGGSDVLARFAHGSASLVFELEVHAVETSDGAQTPVRAAVHVRVQELGPLPPRGTQVRVIGWYEPPGAPVNPGGRVPHSDGSVVAPRLALVQLLGGGQPTTVQRVRGAADRVLEDSFPAWAPDTWRALVKAMTTGVRMPQLVVPGAEFRMAGMSHILAISGFNVAVLVGVGAAVAGLLGAGVVWRAASALAISVMFLLVTEPEVSVLRAGLGAGLAAVAGIRGGRARGLGTLGAVAAATLLMDPGSLFSAGFQLSYGVVLGLLTLAGAPAERWTERTQWLLARIAPQRVAKNESLLIVLGAFVGACISSVVACTVSTPIALCHGGFMSTYAAPISVVTMPAAALVTVGGVLAIAAGSVWSTAAAAPGWLSCGCAGFLNWVAHIAGDWPGTCWWTGRPSLWWVALASASVALAWKSRTALMRRLAWMAVLILAALVWFGAARPHAGAPAVGDLSVEMLDVGNGSCILLRTSDAALLYDAGTSSDDSAGSRRIVPALAALGVRRIDALAISHVSMEHFSAVPEVVRAFDIRRVIVSEALARQAADASERRDALWELNDWLSARGRTLEPHALADELRLGSMAISVVAPASAAQADRAGDSSLVLRVRHVGATNPAAAVLLTGGLRQSGCLRALRSARLHPEFFEPCAVVELPAHGAWSQEAADFAVQFHPRVVLQSAGDSRTRIDRWARVWGAETMRGITARHGALRAIVDQDARVALTRWTASGWLGVDQNRTPKVDHVADP